MTRLPGQPIMLNPLANLRISSTNLRLFIGPLHFPVGRFVPIVNSLKAFVAVHRTCYSAISRGTSTQPKRLDRIHKRWPSVISRQQRSIASICFSPVVL